MPYAYTYKKLQVHVYACVCTTMCVHVYVQPCVCMCMYNHVCVFVCVCICMYNHACAYVQYIHMHVHMHVYVPTHTFFFCLKDFEKFLSPPLFLLLLFLSLGLPLFLLLLRLTSMLIVSLPFILQLCRSWSIIWTHYSIFASLD